MYTKNIAQPVDYYYLIVNRRYKDINIDMFNKMFVFMHWKNYYNIDKSPF